VSIELCRHRGDDADACRRVEADCEGQGLLSTIISLNKTFTLTDRFHFVLTRAASDVFNRPGFNDLDTDISDQTGGQYYDITPDRVGDRSGRRMISIKGRIGF
jgi:hypothetical protein